tara:strand:- start:5450 stop:6226 length:777 start_codon:yes stop_codon:yes gene_type:complete
MISLILCTIGRYSEVKEFLDSLEAQTCKEFELIIVDQNIGHEIEKLLASYSFARCKYFNVNFKGLSKARNFGMNFCSGVIWAFPDDDCLYDTKVIENVLSQSNSSMSEIFMADESFYIAKKVYASSYKLFFRSSLIKNISFDESFGVGSNTIFGAAEEIDFTCRAYYETNSSALILSSVKITHPPASPENFPLAKIKKYSCGNGAFYCKNFGLYAAVKFSFSEIINSLFDFSPKRIIAAIYKLKGAFLYKFYRAFFYD